MMGAAEQKTPKAVLQLMLAVATAQSSPAPESIVEHEQILRKSQFEAIASARSTDALTTMWRTLLTDMSAEEIERVGYGKAIRHQAHEVLLRRFKKDIETRNSAGHRASSSLERLIESGDLPPRPGQVVVPAPKNAEKSDAADSSATKAKRSRKKAANG